MITSVSHAVTEGITTETTSSTDGKTKSYSYAYCDDTYTYDFTWKVEGKPSQELVSETEEKRRGTQACKELMAKATACDPDYTTRNPDDCDPNSRSKEEICRETAYPYTFSGDTSLCRGLSPTGHSDATACKRACCEKEDCIIWQFGGTPRKCWLGKSSGVMLPRQAHGCGNVATSRVHWHQQLLVERAMFSSRTSRLAILWVMHSIAGPLLMGKTFLVAQMPLALSCLSQQPLF